MLLHDANPSFALVIKKTCPEERRVSNNAIAPHEGIKKSKCASLHILIDVFAGQVKQKFIVDLNLQPNARMGLGNPRTSIRSQPGSESSMCNET